LVLGNGQLVRALGRAAEGLAGRLFAVPEAGFVWFRSFCLRFVALSDVVVHFLPFKRCCRSRRSSSGGWFSECLFLHVLSSTDYYLYIYIFIYLLFIYLFIYY
jgi:hypothetical protein